MKYRAPGRAACDNSICQLFLQDPPYFAVDIGAVFTYNINVKAMTMALKASWNQPDASEGGKIDVRSPCPRGRVSGERAEAL